jgi:hypothetical protein
MTDDEVIRRILRRYVRHTDNCPAYTRDPVGGFCTCGLYETLTEYGLAPDDLESAAAAPMDEDELLAAAARREAVDDGFIDFS